MTLSEGDVNSGPDGCGVAELVRTDGPGFNLCAASLNRLVLDFVAWDRGWVNKRRSRGILDRRCRRARREVKDVKLIGDKVANGLGLKGGNLVNNRTGSMVHWRLAFIAMGDYAGSQAQHGDE